MKELGRDLEKSSSEYESSCSEESVDSFIGKLGTNIMKSKHEMKKE